MKDITIVGGGPAGAYLAYLLAKDGVEVTIFDDSHPREKPCGGGISPKALEKFPILRKIHHSKRMLTDIKVISPKNVEVHIKREGHKQAMNVSRLHLDKYLLDKAVDEGTELIEERVTDVKQENDGWILKTRQNTLKTKTIVGADGTKSIVRQRTVGDIPKENLALTRGYMVEGIETDYNLIKFLNDTKGYIWAFPREDHTSIGIGTEIKHSKDSIYKLDRFIKSTYKNISILNRWSALIPHVTDVNFYKTPCAGENWILIGDAAGHVDPITEEGIIYALWSAELACDAIVNENPKLFERLWRDEYEKDLATGVRLSRLFYNPLLLELSISIAKRSKTCAQIVYDVITSKQDYRTLVKRIMLDTPNIIFDIVRGNK